MNIGFTYNVKRKKESLDPKEEDDLEFDSPFVINTIANIIKGLGHNVTKVEANEKAFSKLLKLKGKIDLVFNIAEGLKGDARESQIPIYCELLGIPYTHSTPTTHAVSLNKEMCKALVKSYGVRTPNSQLFGSVKEELSPKLMFPLIVKPNKEGSSKGVFDNSIVKNKEELKRAVKVVIEDFKQEALVEEFIDGREFTVSILGNENPTILPVVEQRFDSLPSGMNKIAGFELKWIYEDSLKNLEDAYYCPPKISKKVEEQITEMSLKVYKCLEVRECARIDYRLDENENLYFIEINTLPGMNPDPKIVSYLPTSVRKAGMTYQDLIKKILDLAIKRYNLS